MAGKVGEAFVEIVADYKQFVTKAQKELNVLLERLAAKADFEPLSEASGDAGEDSAKEYTERFEREVNSSTSKTRRKQTGERIGRDFSKAVNDGADRDRDRRGNIFTRLFGGDDKGRDRNILGGVLGGIGGALGSLFSIIGSAGSAIGSVIGTVSSLSSGFLTLLTVTLILGPAVFALTAALVSLSGIVLLLPVGLAALGAIAGVVGLAFSGFGDAISALASGDMKKFDEALKKLSPSARTVAGEFQSSLLPAFDKLKSKVQEAFFRPLVGTFDRLGNSLLPALTPKLEDLASKLGAIAGIFLDKLSSPQGIAFFEQVLSTIADIVDAAGPNIENLFTAIGNAIIESLPFAERLFNAISDGLGDFGDFINDKIKDGTFQDFLDNALQTGSDFVDVIKELLGLFGALFEDTDEGGQRFLEDISEALGKLTDFFKSKDGKAALQAFIDLAGLLGDALIEVSGNVGAVYRGLKKIKNAAEDAWEWLGKVFDRAERASEPGVAAGIRFLKDLPFFADGGVVTNPTLGMIGEAGPEVVVPLSNPRRAKELMQETGLVDLASGMGGGGDTQVIVYLGTEQITDILDKRITKANKNQGRRLAQGVREG